MFGGEYTYNGNDKKSITEVIDYVYRKRVAKAGLDSIKKGDKIIFHQEWNKKWGCYEKGRIILVLALTLILVTLSGCFYKDYCNDSKRFRFCIIT